MDEKKSRTLALVDALAKCPTLAEKADRDLCVGLLDDPIPSKIKRHDDRTADLQSIVSACLDYEGGIDGLVAAVDGREKSSVHMPLVRERADALKEAAKRERARDREPPELANRSVVCQLEGGYALSIGISKYSHVLGADNKPAPKPFPDLEFAANDANEFHKFLSDRGYQGPEPLTDENATLKGIMRKLDELQRKCQESTDPLVLIFFSGHGARDADGRHYLVPHDGVRDDLFATTLWSRTFDCALRDLKTKRLVVFLDCCHAAGIEADSDKGEQACDPKSLLENQDGRYIVASCLSDQLSRKENGHGIFSEQLLALLRCEKEEDFKDEEIELFGLYDALKQRVSEKTGGRQVPWADIEKPTRIVLGINSPRRKARAERQKSLLYKVDEDFATCAPEAEDRELIYIALLKYINLGTVGWAPERFYRYFRSVANKLPYALPPGLITEIRSNLIEYYHGGEFTVPARDPLGGHGSHASSAEDKVTTSPAAIRPVGPNRSPTTSDQDAPERHAEKRPSTRVGTPTSSPLPERRCLPSDDVSYLLENINKKATKANYSGRIALLKGLLSRTDGMSEKEFKAQQSASCRDGDLFWASLVDEMGERFELRWPNAFKPGAWTCLPSELTDLSLLAGRLRQLGSPVDIWLAGRLSFEAKDALVEYQGSGPDPWLEEALLLCLNTIIHGPSIWDEERFGGVELRPGTARVRSQNPQGEDLQRLNRMLLEDAYPKGLLRKQSLQDPLSVRSRILGSGAGSNA